MVAVMNKVMIEVMCHGRLGLLGTVFTVMAEATMNLSEKKSKWLTIQSIV